MAGYSKESERQNQVLKDLLSGKEHTKKYVQVGYEGKGAENKGGETRKSELSDIMATVRMPWYCPSCKKVMKKKLDNKFWRINGHCFDCQVEMENKLRINGEYEEWENSKVKANQKAYLNDLLVSLDEWRNASKIEFQEQVGVKDLEVEKEKWVQSEEQVKEMADKAEKFIRKTLKEIE